MILLNLINRKFLLSAVQIKNFLLSIIFYDTNFFEVFIYQRKLICVQYLLSQL